MALRTSTEREITFHSSRVTTAIYLAEFQRLFQQTHDEIARQRQNQFALARFFFEQASIKFQTIPSRTETAKLLLECMRLRQAKFYSAEPAVLTLEIAEALVAMATGANLPYLSPETSDFLTEAGSFPLENKAGPPLEQPVTFAGFAGAHLLR